MTAWCNKCQLETKRTGRGCHPCRRRVCNAALIRWQADNREQLRIKASARREELAGLGVCINGSKHGPATHGKRCAWCHDVHRRGLDAVLANPKFTRPGVQP